MLKANTTAGERGSIVVSISALMLLLLIGTALIARSQAELGAVAASTDAEAAQAGAELGVAEVLARLESGETGSFSGDGEVGEGKYAYKAEQLSETEYVVRAEGYVGDRAQAVEVTIGGGSIPPYTFLINHKASFNNNPGTVAGRVGTNGAITVQGTAPGDVVDLFGRDAECGACPVTNSLSDPLDLPDPVLPTGTVQNCPSDGRFTGLIDGENGVPYVCTSANMSASRVRFSGTVTVANPPLVIYVREGLDVQINNGSVNADGEPNDFQLYAEGEESIYWWFDIYNSKVHGVLYAPNRDWLVDSASLYGTITAGVFATESNADVWMTPLESGTTSTGWTVTSWEQVPAS